METASKLCLVHCKSTDLEAAIFKCMKRELKRLRKENATLKKELDKLKEEHEELTIRSRKLEEENERYKAVRGKLGKRMMLCPYRSSDYTLEREDTIIENVAEQIAENQSFEKFRNDRMDRMHLHHVVEAFNEWNCPKTIGVKNMGTLCRSNGMLVRDIMKVPGCCGSSTRTLVGWDWKGLEDVMVFSHSGVE